MFLYLLSFLYLPIAYLVIVIAVITSGLEFIIGYAYLKFKNVMLWDYSKEFMNFKGLICLKFSILWVILSLIYYYLIIPFI